MNANSHPLSPYSYTGSITNKCFNIKKLVQFLLSRNYILLATAFLLGRITLFGGPAYLGIAFYSASYSYTYNKLVVPCFIIAGMLSTGYPISDVYTTCIQMILYIVFFNMYNKVNIKSHVIKNSIVIATSTFTPNIIIAFFRGFLFYDILHILFYSSLIFVLNYIFQNSMIVLRSKTPTLSKQQIICIGTLICFALTGIGNLHILSIGIRDTLIMLTILMFGYCGGICLGATMGTIVSIILSITCDSSTSLCSSYAICAICSAWISPLGKIASSLGFIGSNTLLSLHLDKFFQPLMLYKEMIASTIMFAALPQSIIQSISKLICNENKSIDNNYDSLVKKIVLQKLSKFSEVFKELSKTLESTSSSNDSVGQPYISTILHSLSEKVCSKCKMYPTCWNKNLYCTYQMVLKTVEELEENNDSNSANAKFNFSCPCNYREAFINAITTSYEMLKRDNMWKNKISESRTMASKQLNTLSYAISQLSSDIETNITFKSNLKAALLTQLEKASIRNINIEAIENRFQRLEINIYYKLCNNTKNHINIIQDIVSSAVGKKMVKSDEESKLDFNSELCVLKLVEKQTFTITLGISKISKNGQDTSGDSYTFMNNGDGKYIIALSDGMGSGIRAATQSRATINMLEQFIESGFDKDTSINLINSTLILKSDEDSFATIDLSIIDLYDGDVEFVKIGAVPTFVKKCDRTDVVKSISLPAGILSSLETELVHKQVQSGDFIIMMTDGIYDAFKTSSSHDRSLVNFINQINSQNPKEIADTILNRANQLYDCKPADDMSVIAARVWAK